MTRLMKKTKDRLVPQRLRTDETSTPASQRLGIYTIAASAVCRTSLQEAVVLIDSV